MNRRWKIATVLGCVVIVAGLTWLNWPEPIRAHLGQVIVTEQDGRRTYEWWFGAPKALNLVVIVDGTRYPLEIGSGTGRAIHMPRLIYDLKTHESLLQNVWWHDCCGDDHNGNRKDQFDVISQVDLSKAVLIPMPKKDYSLPCKLDLLRLENGKVFLSVAIVDSPKSREEMNPTLARILRVFGFNIW